MIFYATGHEFEMSFESLEEVPNPDDERFYSLLEAMNKPFMGRVCAFLVVSGNKNVQ